MKSERLGPEASTSPESQHRHFWDIAAVALLGPVLGVAGVMKPQLRADKKIFKKSRHTWHFCEK